jgi:hypothetical protein
VLIVNIVGICMDWFVTATKVRQFYDKNRGTFYPSHKKATRGLVTLRLTVINVSTGQGIHPPRLSITFVCSQSLSGRSSGIIFTDVKGSYRPRLCDNSIIGR